MTTTPEKKERETTTRNWREEAAQTPPTKSMPGKVNSPIIARGGFGADNGSSVVVTDPAVKSHEAEVARLRSERDNLLETGVFDADSEVIKELDRLYNVESFKLSEARTRAGAGVGQ